MRFKIILALVLVPLFVAAQKQEMVDGKMLGIMPVDDTGRPSYQVVKSVAGISKDELFKRGRKWFVKTYNSAQSVLQTNDPNTGELIGKGIFNVEVAALGIGHVYPIAHTISLEVKDEKYRVIINDLIIKDPKLTATIDNVPMMGKKFHARMFEAINTKVQSMLDSLDKALRTTDDF